jgi:hypothetical protein
MADDKNKQLDPIDILNREAALQEAAAQAILNAEAQAAGAKKRGRPSGSAKAEGGAESKPADNKVVKLLEKNPLGMTLPEMAGGPRQMKRIRTLRPQLQSAIQEGLVMPVSQRAGHTVYKLVKHLGRR